MRKKTCRAECHEIEGLDAGQEWPRGGQEMYKGPALSKKESEIQAGEKVLMRAHACKKLQQVSLAGSGKHYIIHDAMKYLRRRDALKYSLGTLPYRNCDARF